MYKSESDRDAQIYANYLLAKELRAKNQCIKFGISESRYKAIIAEQKKLSSSIKQK